MCVCVCVFLFVCFVCFFFWSQTNAFKTESILVPLLEFDFSVSIIFFHVNSWAYHSDLGGRKPAASAKRSVSVFWRKVLRLRRAFGPEFSNCNKKNRYQPSRNKTPPFQGQTTPLSRGGFLLSFYFLYKMCIKIFSRLRRTPLSRRGVLIYPGVFITWRLVRWCVSCVFAERFDFVVEVSALQGCNCSAQRMQAVKCKYSIQQVRVRGSNVFSMHIFFSKVRLWKFLGSSKFLMKWKVPPPPKTVSHRFHNYT